MITQTHNRGSTRNSAGNPSAPHRREEPPRRTSGASGRAKKRHHGLIIFYAITFLIVIAAAVALSLTVLFKIDTIEVTGTTRYAVQDIINASGIEKGDNLFLANTSQAGAAIKKKLPYIGTVAVSRKLPAKISITVGNAAISGAIKYSSGYILISSDGKALEQVSALPTSCPVVLGLELASAKPGATVTYKATAPKALFEELTASLQKNKMDKITKIDISDTYRILVEYDHRITMNFGLASGIDYKIRLAKSVIGKLEPNAKGVLNCSIAEENNQVIFDPEDSSSSAVSSAGTSSTKASSSGTSSKPKSSGTQ